MALHRIVIVGGGAGGLELAVRLGRSLGRRGKAEITLVDRTLTHLWKPLLHEVAAGTIDSHDDAVEFLALARVHHFRFRLGEMEGLDRAARSVRLAAVRDEDGEEVVPAGDLAYDTLVIAVGGSVDTFGIAGVAEHCRLLDDRRQAERFQRDFLRHHLRAESGAPPKRDGWLNVGIVGAGATGVELAAELHASTRLLVEYGLERASAQEARLFLIEAADRVLPGLPERLSLATAERLREIGVEVHVGEAVDRVSADGIHTAGGRFFPCRMKVWAAGVKAPDFLARLDGLETNRRNQLVVRPTLQTAGDDNVFAFGDCAAAPWPGHEAPVPPRAQAASQQAALLARSLPRRIAGRPLLAFAYRDRGSLVSLSRYDTVANVMGNLLGEVTFEGWTARVAYRSLYRLHQRVIFGWPRTLLVIAADWFRQRTGPALKLH